jgi:hypothetical protein
MKRQKLYSKLAKLKEQDAASKKEPEEEEEIEDVRILI